MVLCSLWQMCEMSGMVSREGMCLPWVGTVPLEEVDSVVELGLGMCVGEGIQLKGCEALIVIWEDSQ